MHKFIIMIKKLYPRGPLGRMVYYGIEINQLELIILYCRRKGGSRGIFM